MESIFIVGTGRSGTHFLTKIMNGFSNTYDPSTGNETGNILYKTVKAALHHKELPNSVIKYHNNNLITKKVYVDQCHPNLFHVNQLKQHFNKSVFLYIERPTVQIVASMLNHKGVINWYKYVQKKKLFFNRVPYPNRFLGIESIEELSRQPLHILCALRVLAHKREMMKQKHNLRIVKYESLVKDIYNTVNNLFTPDERKLLGRHLYNIIPNSDSLYKYIITLTNKEILDIISLDS